MSAGVNLVPHAFLRARRRSRRRNAWLAVVAATAFLFLMGWGGQRLAAHALHTVEYQVENIEQQRSDVQRQLLMAAGRRSELVDQLRTVTESRRPQPWAQRLTTLTDVVPAGVLITSIDIGTGGRVVVGNRRPPRGPANTAANATDHNLQPVQMRGHALDHGALIQMLNTLQQLPGWTQVELVRATLGPFRTGAAVAFELDCQTLEDVQ